ncbi:MAG: hypothetical protein R2716_02305 [Microthrixaceae bacterium]
MDLHDQAGHRPARRPGAWASTSRPRRRSPGERGYDPFGARPLRRAIQRLVEDPLGAAALEGVPRRADHQGRRGAGSRGRRRAADRVLRRGGLRAPAGGGAGGCGQLGLSRPNGRTGPRHRDPACARSAAVAARAGAGRGGRVPRARRGRGGR